MKVDQYYLDGFRQLDCGKCICYEFYGCYYHCCIYCFPDKSKLIRRKHREDGHWMVSNTAEYMVERESSIKNCMEFREGIDEFVVI